MDSTQLYTISQAGEMLGVSSVTVWRWVNTGRIRGINLTEGEGKPMLRVRADDLLQFIDDQTLNRSA